jgi:pimeloyl-ACP methyl ester carboxylesterase
MKKDILPEIATKKELTVNGRIYPIIEAGEGPLALCLHGFPDNYETFYNQIEPFVAAGYRVICPMMPGFSPGTRAPKGNNSPVYATNEIIAMIEGLLSTSGEKKCHLVGHDWGALTAYQVANQRPDLLISLTALSIPYNINLPRVLLRCPSYAVNGWYVTFFQLIGLADWMVKRKNMKFLDMLYRTWCPTWDKAQYEDRLVSVKETLSAPGVLTATLGYYRNSIYGLNRSSRRFRKWFSGKIDVPTLAIRGEVDWCIPEAAWELHSAKSFRKELTMEVMPGIGHFPQLEDPKWISERLIKWFNHNPV